MLFNPIVYCMVENEWRCLSKDCIFGGILLDFMSRGLAAYQHGEDCMIIIDRRDLRLKRIWRKEGIRTDDFMRDLNNAEIDCEK